ncbi:MAG: HAD family hydrolase [Phycisphaerae bacterium]|nr:HAD family hydrolase [Phycisphaerae bacterium]
MIRAVLFDLGDTLVNFGEVDHYAAFREGAALAHKYLLEAGEPVCDLKTFHRRQLRAIEWAYFRSKLSWRDCDTLKVLAKINRRMGLTTRLEDLERLCGLFYEPVRVQGTLEPRAHEVLARLRDNGCQLGLISNTIVPGVTLDDHMRREGLLEFFPFRFYSCEVGCRKPQRRIFRMALRTMGVDAGGAAFVGDTLVADIKGANRAGMISVLKATDGHRPTGRIQPDHVIAALSELPGLIEDINRSC